MTSATRLLEKRRELADIETTLSSEKEEFQLKMEALSRRNEDLERRETQLKENLLKFDKFLRENEAKKARAQKKSQEEKRLKETKELEVDSLRELVQRLTKVKDRQQDALTKSMNVLINVLITKRFKESALFGAGC
jgi:alanyl-tRNA synthetase